VFGAALARPLAVEVIARDVDERFDRIRWHIRCGERLTEIKRGSRRKSDPKERRVDAAQGECIENEWRSEKTTAATSGGYRSAQVTSMDTGRTVFLGATSGVTTRPPGDEKIRRRRVACLTFLQAVTWAVTTIN
jgi:hypothetical protein